MNDALRPAATSQPAPMVCVAGWLVPGAGHLLVGQGRKAFVLFAVLMAMFVIGLGLGGRLFPVQASEPLVILSALAQWSIGLPRAAAWLAGWGSGDVVAATYEYGNTFLIAGGLLNALAVLDAYHFASGRKPR